MITYPLVLPADVRLGPGETLPRRLRDKIAPAMSDYILSYRHGHALSPVVDAETAALLAEFRSARTIAEAILHYSRQRGVDPEKVLEEAFPLLEYLIQAQLLVRVDAPEARHIAPTFEEGTRIGNLVIQQAVQLGEDTEVYCAIRGDKEPVALKILRPSGQPQAHDALAREAVILRHLDGQVNPHLLAVGALDLQPYLILQWCTGVPAIRAAAALRDQQATPQRSALAELCLAVLDAYAHLHAQQIIHADVHARNIHVSPDGSIKILDYGLARRADMAEAEGIAPRGGVAFSFEPEYAATLVQGRQPRAASMSGEQYALAALVYLLLTGTHYLDFSLEHDVALRQIIEDRPRPFSQCGQSPWPAAEAVLARALSKDPAARFPSVAAFAAQLRAAITSAHREQHQTVGDMPGPLVQKPQRELPRGHRHRS